MLCYPSLFTGRVINQKIISSINHGNGFNCESGVVTGCHDLTLPELRLCLCCTLCQGVSYHSETRLVCTCVCVHTCVCVPLPSDCYLPEQPPRHDSICQVKRALKTCCVGIRHCAQIKRVCYIYGVLLTHLVLLDIISGCQVRVPEQRGRPTGYLNWMDGGKKRKTCD